MARKGSFNGKGNQQPKQEAKSTSVSKNHVANSLGNKNVMTNNLVGAPPQLMNNKGQNIGNNNINKRGMGMQSPQEVPMGLPRYNSTQYGKK